MASQLFCSRGSEWLGPTTYLCLGRREFSVCGGGEAKAPLASFGQGRAWGIPLPRGEFPTLVEVLGINIEVLPVVSQFPNASNRSTYHASARAFVVLMWLVQNFASQSAPVECARALAQVPSSDGRLSQRPRRSGGKLNRLKWCATNRLIDD